MDVAWITADGGAGTVVVGFVGRWLYVRSRRHHKGLAKEALDNTAVPYEDFRSLRESLISLVDELAAMLGVHDAAALRRDAADTLDPAARLDEDYVAYAVTGTASDPARRARRGQYRQMQTGYRDLLRRISEQLTALRELEAWLQDVQADMRTLPAARARAEAAIAAAEAIVGTRRSEGWNVAAQQEQIEEARHSVTQAGEAEAAKELLTAAEGLATAQATADGVRTFAQQLPRQQRQLLQRAGACTQRAVTAQHLIGEAEAALTALVAAYADACSVGMREELGAARQRRGRVGGSVQRVEQLVEPQTAAWTQAEELLGQIEELLDGIEKLCAKVSGAKDRLDTKMQKLRSGAGDLRRRIGDVERRARDRDGDQGPIFAALNQVGTELEQFSELLGQPRPNPTQLKAALGALNNRVSRVNDRSKQIDDAAFFDDDDDDDDLFTAVIVGGILGGLLG